MATERLQYILDVGGNGEVTLRKFRGELEATDRASRTAAQGFSKFQANIVTGTAALEVLRVGAEALRATFERTFGGLIADGNRFIGLSRQFGVPIEQLSKLDFVAKTAGASVEGLASGLRIFSTGLQGTGVEGERAQRIIQRLTGDLEGVKRQAAQDLPGALLRVGQALNQVTDQSQRTAAAAILFGRGFGDVLKIAQSGDAQQLIAYFEKVGAVMTTKTAVAAEGVEVGFAKLQAATRGLLNEIEGRFGVLDSLSSALDGVAEKVANLRGAINDDGTRQAFDDLRDSAKDLATSVVSLVSAFSNLTTIESVISRVSSLIEGLSVTARIAAIGVGGFKVAVTSLPGFSDETYRQAQRDQESLMNSLVNQLGDFQDREAARSLARAGRHGVPGLGVPSGAPLPEPGHETPPTDRPGRAGGVSLTGLLGGKTAGGGEQANKLAELKAQIDDLHSGLPAFDRDIDKTAASFGKLADVARPMIRELALAKIFEGLDEKIASAQTHITELTKGPLAAFQAKVDDALRKEHLLGSADEATARARFEAEVRATDFAVPAAEKVKSLKAEIEDLIDPTAAAARELKEAQENAAVLGDTDLSRQLVQLTAMKNAVMQFNSVFDLVKQGFDQLLEGLISGTRKFSDVLQGLKATLVKFVGDWLIEQAKIAAAGFLFGGGPASGGGGGAGAITAGGIALPAANALLENAGFSGGGGSGILGSLFGGGGSGAGSAFLGGAVGQQVLGSSGATLGLLGLGLGAAQSGGGFKLNGLSGGLLGLSALRTIIPLLVNHTALGAQLGASALNAFGSYAPAVGSVLGLNASSPALGGLAAGQIGPQTAGQAAQQAGGLASNLSSLVSVIGSLYSLYSSVSGTVKTVSSFSKATLGDTRANTNFSAASYAGLGAATGIGAGIGAGIGSAGGPIGTVVGALVGAAIGAALAQATASAIAQGVGKGVAAGIRQGLTQGQLTKKVGEELAGSLILNVLSGWSNTQLAPLVSGFVTPDIEDIFDKILRQTVSQATGGTIDLNRHRTTVAPGTDVNSIGNTKGLGALLTVLTGAGAGEGGERLRRFPNILYNSLVNRNDPGSLLNAIFLGVSGGRFFRAVSQGRKVDAFYGNSPFADVVPQVFAGQDTAFGNVLPGANLGALRNVFTAFQTAPGHIQGKDTKASFDLVSQAFQGVVTGQTSVADFGGKLAQGAASALDTALSKSVVSAGFGDLLDDFFRTTRRGVRQLRRTGNQGDFATTLDEAGQRLAKGFQALTPVIANMKDAFNTGLKFTVQLQLAAGDKGGALASLTQRLAPVTQTLQGIRQLARDVRSRSAFALAGAGTAGDEAALVALREQTATAFGGLSAIDLPYSSILGPSGRRSQTLADLLGTSGTAAGLARSGALAGRLSGVDWTRALPLLQDFANARLSELEAELNLARKLQQAFGGVHDAAQNFLDTLAVTRNGPSARGGIFARDRRAFIQAAGRAAFDQGNPDRLLEVVNRGQTLLQEGSQIFSPGSREFADLLDLIEPVIKSIDTVALTEKAKAKDREDTAKAQVEAFNADVTPILEAATTDAGNAVAAEIVKLQLLFTNDGGVLDLLRGIGKGLQLKGFAAGGYTGGRRPIIVGERGPELFVPETAGTVIPHGGLGGTTVNVSITVGGGSADPVEDVITALRQNKPRLITELRRKVA